MEKQNIMEEDRVIEQAAEAFNNSLLNKFSTDTELPIRFMYKAKY